jgi:MFS transporter, PAT family, beta-lactamase induction signal transducer AmpG
MNSVRYANVMGPDTILRNAQRHDTHRHERAESFELTMLSTGAKPKPTLWQALSDKRMTAILFMSFASGLPFNLTGFTLQAWLTSVGLDLKTIGFITLVGVPYVYKFLWAPLIDRYSPPILGRRRGWILIFQGGLAVAIGAMGFFSPTTELYTLACVALLVAVLSATQDIVIDAYRVDTIPASERSVAAAVAAFGYRTAAMLAGAVLVSIAAHLGWKIAFLLVGMLMAGTMYFTWRAPEPVNAGRPPQTLAQAVWLPLKDLVQQKGAWGFLLLVVLYKAGDAFALSLYSAFMLRGPGFTLDQLSVAKLSMTVATIVGVSLGGWLYLRWGMYRSLLIFGIAQALTNLLYMWLALVGNKFWLMIVATVFDTLAGGMGQAAFVAFLMSLCSTSFSATQYALLSALASVPRVVTGAIAGYVAPAVGWPNFFVITCLTAVPGLIVLLLLAKPVRAVADRDTAASKA